MLKTIRSFNKPAPNKNNGSKSVFNINDNSRPAFGRNNGNGEVNRFGDYIEYNKKLGKSKSKKLFKPRKLAKSEKNLSKSGNSPNFNAKNNGPSFLNLKARTAFIRLRLAFIKTPILWHLDLEWHIRIEINALGYVIGDVPSQFVFGTRPNEVLTKTDLSQWHLVAFFFRKMIPAKRQSETYNGKIIAIVKAFKTWCHYLEGCK